MKKLLILIICMTTLAGCVIQRGSHIRTGEYRQPTSIESIQLYYQQPAQFKVLGMVTGEASHAFVSDQQRMNKAIERMKKEAAALGANGILIQNAGKVASRANVTQQFGNFSGQQYGNQTFGQFNGVSVSSGAQDSVVNGLAIYVEE